VADSGDLTRIAATVAVSWALLACQTGTDGSGTTVSSDSAGVLIVRSSAPAWTDASAWRIQPDPLVEIGIESGDEAYQLNRVLDALRLPDGSILVGNSGSGEIRVFDPAGRFVRSIGRVGNGPGEFGEMSSVRVTRAEDGSLLGYDNGNLRLHHFDSSGTYVRTIRIESTSDGLRAFYQGSFSDGSWLTLASRPELRNEPGAYLRSSQQFVRFSTEGKPLNLLRRVEGRTRFVHKYGDIVHYPFVPFTAEPLARAFRDRLFIVGSRASEAEERDLEGRLVRVFRLDVPLERSADAFPRYRDASLASMDSVQRARYDHFYGLNHPLPETVPAFQSLLVDDEGSLWLERYRLPGDAESRWEVVARDGTWLGQIVAPPRLRLYQVGRDFVLGRHLDSLGVERVRVHKLTR
jgi:hypothetical protein